MTRHGGSGRPRAGRSVRALVALLALGAVACDGHGKGDAPDADADAEAAGLGFGEACLRNPLCESRMCLVVPGEETGHCTRACTGDAECSEVAGWVCGEVAGTPVCVSGADPGDDADADADADADGCPEQARVAGGVTVFELIFPVASYNRGNATAHFARLADDPTSVEPDWSDGEHCEAYVGHDLEVDLTAQPSLDAGTIQVGGAKLAVTLSRDPFDKAYSSSVLPDNPDLFGPGSVLRVEAAGGEDLAAYTLEAPTPSSLRVNHPRNNGSVSRAADLDVTWEPDGGGAVTALLVAATADDQGGSEVTSISCAAEDEDGQLRLPAAALALLPVAAESAVFSVSRVRAAGDRLCEAAVGLTVSTSFTVQLRLAP